MSASATSTSMVIHAQSQDGLWSVIQGLDYPPGIGRSRTRKTPGDALKAQWEPALVTPPGPATVMDFVLVRTMDLPGYYNPKTGTIGTLVSPKSYIDSGKAPKKFIPDYPGKCAACGGPIVQLFSSTEHQATGTERCPEKPVTKLRLR